MFAADEQGFEARSGYHLSDDNILAILDDTAPPSLGVHLVRCKSCAARAAELMNFERHLRQWLYRALCPTSMDLLAYMQRKLNPGQFIRISEHLIDCDDCVNELHMLEAANCISPSCTTKYQYE